MGFTEQHEVNAPHLCFTASVNTSALKGQSWRFVCKTVNSHLVLFVEIPVYQMMIKPSLPSLTVPKKLFHFIFNLAGSSSTTPPLLSNEAVICFRLPIHKKRSAGPCSPTDTHANGFHGTSFSRHS